MKNKNLLIAISIIAAIIIVIAVKKRKFKKYELTTGAKNMLQVYQVDKNGKVDYLSYATGTTHAKAAPSKEYSTIAEIDGVTQQYHLIPVKKIWFNNGQTQKFNSKKSYIERENLIID